MEDTLQYWFLQTVAMMITALLIPRLRITSIIGAFAIVVALALVNATLWNAALFYSLPTSPTVETLVLVVANGAIFWLLVKLIPGMEVQGILPALAAPIVFALVGVFVGRYASEVDLSEVAQSVADAVGRLRAWLESSQTAR